MLVVLLVVVRKGGESVRAMVHNPMDKEVGHPPDSDAFEIKVQRSPDKERNLENRLGCLQLVMGRMTFYFKIM